MESIANIIAVVMAVISVASIIAAITPTPKDDVWIGKLYKLIDLLAVNIGKAKQQAPVVESKDGDS